MPITSNHFVVSEVKHECAIEDFCKEKDLEPSRANLHILLELNSVDKTYILKGATIRDVILMDKVSQHNYPYSSYHYNILLYCVCILCREKKLYLLVTQLHVLIQVSMRQNGVSSFWLIMTIRHH